MQQDSPRRPSITADMVASVSISYAETHLHEGRLYWMERRPQQGGRTTIMCHHEGNIDEILPVDHDCRTRAHEYGGGCYAITESTIYFIDDADQQVHALTSGVVDRLTDAPHRRFADLIADPEHHRLFAVCEDHSGDDLPENYLVAIDTRDGSITVLHRGYDFYISPRYDDGRLAWLCWNFPDMPWDATCLFTAHIDDDDRLYDTTLVSGGDGVSICQPEWQADDLYYISDVSGWWNLYRYRDGEHLAIYPVDAECSEPNWIFGLSSYCFLGDDIYLSVNRYGIHQLTRIGISTGDATIIRSDHNHFGYLTSDGEACAMIACSATRQPEIAMTDTDTLQVLVSAPQTIAKQDLSIAQRLELDTRDSEIVHAFYYPPTGGVDESLPPMIVIGHGGPTGQSTAAFELRKQFWTSRGFAILDVNYRGSTGYGRAYRDSLNGRWGERDVQDLCDAALAVCRLGKAATDRLIIKGSSAGGFTVLAALTFEDVFCTGASYYGISDLETLVSDTHKFEARYLDKLVGPYPQTRQTYIDRSPIHHVDRLSCPVIFFQGEEDLVVPKQQAEAMIDVLLAKGIQVGYRLYAGEQHGFRKAETIVDALETELCFYRRMLTDDAVECDAALVKATAEP